MSLSLILTPVSENANKLNHGNGSFRQFLNNWNIHLLPFSTLYFLHQAKNHSKMPHATSVTGTKMKRRENEIS